MSLVAANLTPIGAMMSACGEVERIVGLRMIAKMLRSVDRTLMSALNFTFQTAKSNGTEVTRLATPLCFSPILASA
jgi:hypothetical protein